jgi:predicted ATP-grasp superfamily ATP-dependent carboligase
MSSALAKFVPNPVTAHSANGSSGAVVVGGDYQGLGIVRSLGCRGIPVCVADDERSISRFSRYCTHNVRLANLRDERKVVGALLEIGKRRNLKGWVLYPTREELVAAFSRNRAQLSELFRVPTPEWSSVRWAWDKRNTYRLAKELGIPTPVTHYPEAVERLAELDSSVPPFAIKPAIKEHFIYTAKAKAWRADSHSELKALLQKACKLVGPGEAMVQEVIPGGGWSTVLILCLFRPTRFGGLLLPSFSARQPSPADA